MNRFWVFPKDVGKDDKEHSSFFAKGLRSRNSSVIVIFSLLRKNRQRKRQNEKAQFKVR